MQLHWVVVFKWLQFGPEKQHLVWLSPWVAQLLLPFSCELVEYMLQLWIIWRKMNPKIGSKMNLLNRLMVYSVAFPPWSNQSFRWNPKFFLPSLFEILILICSRNTWWIEMWHCLESQLWLFIYFVIIWRVFVLGDK